jgi:peptide/nickel transport system ATP-binding protein
MVENRALSIQDLKLYFKTSKGFVQAVDDVSFDLYEMRTLVIVGESGSGKSSLARAILRLLPKNIHTYTGQILLYGDNIMTYNDERFRREVRWSRIAMVPQAAMNALNPVVKIEKQVAEPLLVHGLANTDEAIKRVKQPFSLVGVPLDFLNRYPFELSGGMRQRTAIAMALVTSPKLIVLDEPTSALDVLTQANIMNVLKTVKKNLGTTFVLITHDIATSSELADDVAVMYAGQIIEKSEAAKFFREPLHPYSRKLMASVPTIRERKKLDFIPGQPPSLVDPPTGCRFADRCPDRFGKCVEDPPAVIKEGNHLIKCWLHV